MRAKFRDYTSFRPTTVSLRTSSGARTTGKGRGCPPPFPTCRRMRRRPREEAASSRVLFLRKRGGRVTSKMRPGCTTGSATVLIKSRAPSPPRGARFARTSPRGKNELLVVDHFPSRDLSPGSALERAHPSRSLPPSPPARAARITTGSLMHAARVSRSDRFPPRQKKLNRAHSVRIDAHEIEYDQRKQRPLFAPLAARRTPRRYPVGRHA